MNSNIKNSQTPDIKMSQKISEILKAISHPVRIRIIFLLSNGEHWVGEIAKKLNLNQSLISQHLAILRMTGCVNVVKKEGKSFYSLKDEQLSNILLAFYECKLRQD